MTEHITFEELVEFNSLDLSSLRESTLSSRVGAHIRTCGECRRTLAAIQCAEESLSRVASEFGQKRKAEGNAASDRRAQM